MDQKYVVIVDYISGHIEVYPFYLFENALKCYQGNIEHSEILFSVALMQVDDDANFITLMSKNWR